MRTNQFCRSDLFTQKASFINRKLLSSTKPRLKQRRASRHYYPWGCGCYIIISESRTINLFFLISKTNPQIGEATESRQYIFLGNTRIFENYCTITYYIDKYDLNLMDYYSFLRENRSHPNPTPLQVFQFLNVLLLFMSKDIKLEKVMNQMLLWVRVNAKVCLLFFLVRLFKCIYGEVQFFDAGHRCKIYWKK